MQDKFTHLTAKPELLLDVANHFYKKTSGDWLLLVLDASKLKAEASSSSAQIAYVHDAKVGMITILSSRPHAQVKYEPAAPVGNTAAKSSKPDETIEIFPHLYGGINLDAILSELPVERDSSGTFLSIQGL